MQTLASMRSYKIVLASFLSYLPSRILVILNSLIIVPILAYFLTSSEMSIFQISIGILNFVCTCSTDWIAKSVLRFYRRYHNENRLNEFYSNIAMLEFITILGVFASYFIFKDFVSTKFLLSNKIFFLTLVLVIPCGIRQFLYQLLRILKMPYWYAISIIVYQLSLLGLFFTFSNLIPKSSAILVAMTFAVALIDIILLYKLNLRYKLSIKIDKNIAKNVLIYAIPLVFTNICIWLILHLGKFILQFNKEILNTAIVGTAWFFTTNALTPLFSLLLFAIFPLIIKRFEKKYRLKEFMTNALRLYIAMFLPFVCVFCFYSFDIAKLAFRQEYYYLGLLFPFCAVTIFVHEFMKLMNMKYHLKNRTYVETAISGLVAIVCVVLNFVLIRYFSILGVGIAMLASILLLFTLNSFVNFKHLNFIAPTKVFKTLGTSILISILAFAIVFLFTFKFNNNYVIVAKIIAFCLLYFALTLKFKKLVLK